MKRRQICEKLQRVKTNCLISLRDFWNDVPRTNTMGQNYMKKIKEEKLRKKEELKLEAKQKKKSTAKLKMQSSNLEK